MKFSELIRRYAWPFKKDIGLLVLLTLAGNALLLVNPVIIAAALSVLQGTQSAATGVAAGATLGLSDLGGRVVTRLGLPVASHPWLVLGALAVAYLAQSIGTSVLNYWASLYALRIRIESARRIRLDLLRHLYSLPLKFLDRKSTRLNSSHVSESRMPSSA